MSRLIRLTTRASGVSCDILVTAERLFQFLTQRIESLKSSGLTVITNTTVWKLYGRAFRMAAGERGLKYNVIILPDGEKHKDLATAQKIYNRLLSYKADRSSVLVGVGGGVVTDITGFAASTYMRGIRYINVPTTLLSQVDAAIGGKTGVDFSLIKNVVGTFYQPVFVYSNVRVLKTLPVRTFRAGMAEVIKYGAIKDKGLLSYIERHGDAIAAYDPDTLSNIVHESSAIKTAVVRKDEKETSGVRMLLNFGHTFGHAIESATHYGMPHGEAVGIGMIMAAKASQVLGVCTRDVPDGLERIIRRMQLPTSSKNIDMRLLSESLKYDKKGHAEEISLILLKDLGKPVIYKIKKQNLKKILTEVKV